MNIGNWLNQAISTQDDLDFYELCVSYVASLNDAHDTFLLPSDFVADLGFSADIYEGKVLIDAIDRRRLNAVRFPFFPGDELVSVDGVAASDLIQSLTKYAVAANPLSTSRFAANYITYRDQSFMPHGHLIPDISTVVINLRRQGRQASFSIPWIKTGTPITIVGPVIGPSGNRSTAAGLSHSIPGYMRPLMKLRNMRLPTYRTVVGLGATAPVFNPPAGFVQRMGKSLFDFFYSGTYQSQGVRIGFIRIPSFDTFLPSDQFQSEIDYMQQNTDGLIVDVMRNPGGDPCAAEDLLQRLIPTPFHNIGLEIRATWSWVQNFTQALQDAEDFGASADVIAQYQNLLQQVTAAYLSPSGRTPPLPVCDSTLDLQPATDSNNQNIAYTKPVMLLTDEMTASAAEYFAAVFQDNQRGVLFGMRTMGAGGNVDIFPVTTYSNGAASVTESLMHRLNPVRTPDYPTASYVENVGVRPDVVMDYMTTDNLLNLGSSFVQAFTNAMVQYVNTGRPQ